MLISIIIKNLKVVLRSPFTLLILILAPIILMFIVGYTYSGNTLTNTNVGIINYDGDFFNEFNEIKFIKFKDEQDCLNFLKKGLTELCIDYKENKNQNNQIISADIIYYADITRPQITNILINSFNREINKKTTDISTQTISDIFSEIDETVLFMEESMDVIDNVEEQINDAKSYMAQIKTAVRLTNNKIDSTNSELNFLKSNLDSDYNNFKSDQSKIINDLDKAENQINNAQSSTDDAISDFNNLIDDIETYAEINPEIYSFINFDNLDDIKSSLNSISSSLEYTNSLINLASNTLNENNLDYLDDIKNTVNEIIDLFGESKNYLKDVENKISEFENELDSKEQDLLTSKQKVEEKLNYFSQVSDKDASEIAEPISKKTEYTFSNFKRVHQLAPTVVVLILLFVGLLLSNILVSIEIDSKAYFRNLISPVQQSKFITGLFFTTLIIILFQLLFLFLVLYYYFSVPIFGNFGQIIIVILHIAIVFILFGIFIGYLFESMQISVLITTFSALFLLLLSNIIVPTQIMPKLISIIISGNPVVIAEDLIRKLFYYKSYYVLDIISLIPFYIYIFILIVMIGYASKKRKENVY